MLHSDIPVRHWSLVLVLAQPKMTSPSEVNCISTRIAGERPFYQYGNQVSLETEDGEPRVISIKLIRISFTMERVFRPIACCARAGDWLALSIYINSVPRAGDAFCICFLTPVYTRQNSTLYGRRGKMIFDINPGSTYYVTCSEDFASVAWVVQRWLGMSLVIISRLLVSFKPWTS